MTETTNTTTRYKDYETFDEIRPWIEGQIERSQKDVTRLDAWLKLLQDGKAIAHVQLPRALAARRANAIGRVQILTALLREWDQGVTANPDYDPETEVLARRERARSLGALGVMADAMRTLDAEDNR